MHMQIHEKAPDFELPDQDGRTHRLADYRGKWVVLYFYPKDDTPGCTTEACGFRDSFTDLQKHDVVVLGVSKDTVESHKAFVKKHNLNFLLVSDIDSSVSNEYGAWDNNTHGIKRETFLIDPDGDLAMHYINVDPLIHVQQILSDLEHLNNQL